MLSTLEDQVSLQEQSFWAKEGDFATVLKDFQQIEALQKDLGLHDALGDT
jgi:hypothetical protein